MLLCDYVMEEFAPTWLNYSSDGAELPQEAKESIGNTLRICPTHSSGNIP